MIRQYKDKARREVLRKIGVFASVGAIFIITPGCGTIAPEVSGTSVQTCAPASSLNITTAKFVRFKTQSSCGFDLMHIALESPDDLSGGAVSVNGIEFDYDTRGWKSQAGIGLTAMLFQVFRLIRPTQFRSTTDRSALP